MKRTTYTPAPDVAAVIERVQRELNLGPSEAINVLIRRAAAIGVARPPARFTQQTYSMRALVSLDNIGAVEALLDEAEGIR